MGRREQQMRILLLLAIFLSVSSYAGISLFKVDSDGNYRFKSQPFMVWAPKECMLDMAVRDTNRSVDFTTGAGYWMSSGQYSVQVFTFDQLSIDDTHSFEQRIKDVAPMYMVHDRSKAFKFVFRDAKLLEIAGHPAYQATAIEEGTATFVATFVLQHAYVTVASLVFPIEKPDSKFNRPFPWECYKRFTASVKEVH
jgi:hypothetical protein